MPGHGTYSNKCLVLTIVRNSEHAGCLAGVLFMDSRRLLLCYENGYFDPECFPLLHTLCSCEVDNEYDGYRGSTGGIICEIGNDTLVCLCIADDTGLLKLMLFDVVVRCGMTCMHSSCRV